MINIDPTEYFTETPKRIIPVENPTRGGARDEILDFLGESGHYSRSFGEQWQKYRDVQIDRLNGTCATFHHLKEVFMQGDLTPLEGKTCLEIGSGAGRFTDLLVDVCGKLITIEPSQALTVNVALGHPKLIPAHADLFQIPIRREKVDVVFCRGVTQHTRDTRAAIRRLFDYVKPGGTVLFDVYHLRWFTPFVAKYWLRPFTRGIDSRKFMKWAEHWVPRLLRFKHKFVSPLMPKNALGINLANQIVPVADFTGAELLKDEEQRMAWSILDTVDMYTPRYDGPLTWNSVMRIMEEVGARDVVGSRSTFCFRATAPV
ncbi:MAG: class I SAM-dependent methyltransferase [Verrucomicrobiaceae bacterium]